jgi:hypothetical protein
MTAKSRPAVEPASEWRVHEHDPVRFRGRRYSPDGRRRVVRWGDPSRFAYSFFPNMPATPEGLSPRAFVVPGPEGPPLPVRCVRGLACLWSPWGMDRGGWFDELAPVWSGFFSNASGMGWPSSSR